MTRFPPSASVGARVREKAKKENIPRGVQQRPTDTPVYTDIVVLYKANKKHVPVYTHNLNIIVALRQVRNGEKKEPATTTTQQCERGERLRIKGAGPEMMLCCYCARVSGAGNKESRKQTPGDVSIFLAKKKRKNSGRAAHCVGTANLNYLLPPSNQQMNVVPPVPYTRTRVYLNQSHKSDEVISFSPPTPRSPLERYLFIFLRIIRVPPPLACRPYAGAAVCFASLLPFFMHRTFTFFRRINMRKPQFFSQSNMTGKKQNKSVLGMWRQLWWRGGGKPRARTYKNRLLR